MIDPKLNQVPVESKKSVEDSSEEANEKLRSQRPRSGLSINDTIAGGANLSVGARGVNTSGVDSGSGVGAGATNVTPGNPGESPAPQIVPGSSRTGTTPQSSGTIEQSVKPGVSAQSSGSATAGEAATRLNAGTEGYETSSSDAYSPTYDEIAARAHECWLERGCPSGSPEIDWRQAEEELRSGRVPQGRAYAATNR